MNELIQKLDGLNKGAAVHTISKAAHYLALFDKKIAVGIKVPQLEPLQIAVRVALVTNDWNAVRDMMRRWW